MGINFALYYPSMEFRSISWLKGMLLFWDGIRRIVPESYTPNDDEEIKPFIALRINQSSSFCPLTTAGGIIIPN